MYDENWPRWILASVSDHFATRAAALTPVVPLFIEGQTRLDREGKNLYELRMDGPRTMPSSGGCFTLRVEINVLIHTVLDDQEYHDHHQNIGQVQKMFENVINVYKYGDRVPDDQTYLGCLQLQIDKRSRDFLEANNFGQINEATKIQQATVEGHYEITLNN